MCPHQGFLSPEVANYLALVEFLIIIAFILSLPSKPDDGDFGGYGY